MVHSRSLQDSKRRVDPIVRRKTPRTRIGPGSFGGTVPRRGRAALVHGELGLGAIQLQRGAPRDTKRSLFANRSTRAFEQRAKFVPAWFVPLACLASLLLPHSSFSPKSLTRVPSCYVVSSILSAHAVDPHSCRMDCSFSFTESSLSWSLSSRAIHAWPKPLGLHAAPIDLLGTPSGASFSSRSPSVSRTPSPLCPLTARLRLDTSHLRLLLATSSPRRRV